MATNATGFGAKTQLRPVFLPAGKPGKLSRKCLGWLIIKQLIHIPELFQVRNSKTAIAEVCWFEILLPHSFHMGVAHYRNIVGCQNGPLFLFFHCFF